MTAGTGCGEQRAQVLGFARRIGEVGVEAHQVSAEWIAGFVVKQRDRVETCGELGPFALHPVSDRDGLCGHRGFIFPAGFLREALCGECGDACIARIARTK